jgi:hypothetical protein
MTINSSVKLKYLGYTGANILNDTYLNADRFFKIDAQASQGGTTMTCEEVLESVLNIISACITQQDGAWWVYRPNEFEDNVVFLNHSTFRTFTKNLSITVGSQIDNFYPHHCNGNQQIETKGAISAYRINYKYGFKSGILLNPNLIHDSDLVFEDWTMLNNSKVVNDPLYTYGISLNSEYFVTYNTLESNSFSAKQGHILKVDASLFTSYGGILFCFKLKTSDGKYVDKDGNWTTNQNDFFRVQLGDYNDPPESGFFDFTTSPVLNDCTVTLIICQPIHTDFFTPYVPRLTRVNKIDVVEVSTQIKGRVGEFHTITRNISPSSITKENQEVYNGDSIGDVFEGAIYKQDQETLTTLWSRNDWIEEKTILRISGEDDMRISQKPQKVFIGDFYGYVPYLSIVSINNLVGKFMFIEHSYDTDTNITKGKLKQFYTNEVGGLEYALTYDYGQTVKPSIKS